MNLAGRILLALILALTSLSAMSVKPMTTIPIPPLRSI